MHVHLRHFQNAWYRPGRSLAWQAGWFFLGLPLLRCSILPSSGLRVRLLRIFGAKVGLRVTIKPGVRVKYPWRLNVGDDCWIGEDCWLDNLADISIAADCCVSQGAYLCTGNHDWSDPHFGLILKPITLHRGSWVGARCVIAPGVELGVSAIAGAGSVVTKSIPPYEIHNGNPAAFVRKRVFRSPETASAQYEPLEDFQPSIS